MPIGNECTVADVGTLYGPTLDDIGDQQLQALADCGPVTCLPPTSPKIPLEFDYYITPDGEQYALIDVGAKFVLADSGQGMPPIDYFTTRGPLQHGETVYDFRLRPRTIRMIIRQEGQNRADWWDLRAQLMDALRPNRQTTDSFQTGILRKIYNRDITRDVNCIIATGPEFRQRNLSGWEEWSVVESLDFICHDPVFFDPGVNTLTFVLAASDELTFPIDFTPGGSPASLVFGGSALLDTQTIGYFGTWETFPSIVLTGPINFPTITNNTTGEKISLAFNIPAGRVVTIDLDYGDKTITDDTGTNLLGTLTTDSQLATFHIAPHPEALGGSNELTASGSGFVPGTSAISLSYFTRFIGF